MDASSKGDTDQVSVFNSDYRNRFTTGLDVDGAIGDKLRTPRLWLAQ